MTPAAAQEGHNHRRLDWHTQPPKRSHLRPQILDLLRRIALRRRLKWCPDNPWRDGVDADALAGCLLARLGIIVGMTPLVTG